MILVSFLQKKKEKKEKRKDKIRYWHSLILAIINLLLYYGLVFEHSKSYFQYLFAQRSVVL